MLKFGAAKVAKEEFYDDKRKKDNNKKLVFSC